MTLEPTSDITINTVRPTYPEMSGFACNLTGMTALTLDDAFAEHASAQLADVTFVVVDLETTGGRTSDSGITEIGAVKVRGGQVLGEFQTFVNPGMPIPAFISVLTGITEHHVANAPTTASALVAFLEFAGFAGASEDLPVLVAHNAPFDVGFLKDACARNAVVWPAPLIVDTVTLARRILTGSEVHNRKLATLAEYFHSPTSPTHRALDDARATVHVLHGLIERVGNLAVSDLAGLMSFSGQATEKRRRKRHLADGIPDSPGVYVFYDHANRPLYVGTSRNMRKRVMSYFTAAETRKRMTAMVEIAQRVQAIVCATALEAAIRELRMINEHRPRFNQRSRNPERTAWIALTNERFPRFSIVRQSHPAHDDRVTIGPFRSADAAQHAIDAMHEGLLIRQCKDRISAKTSQTPCALFEMKRCIAPCRDGSDTSAYEEIVAHATEVMLSNPSVVINALTMRMNACSDDQRFEDAALIRDRAAALKAGVNTAARLRSLCAIPEFVAAASTVDGGWDIHVIRHGALAASAHARPGISPRPTMQAARTMGQNYQSDVTLVSETQLVLRWLTQPGVRLIHMTPGFNWATPIAVSPTLQ